MSDVLSSKPCSICGEAADPFDVVDFNKSCEEARGSFLGLSGVPVYYYRCGSCGFVFAPQLCEWTLDEFARRVYNDEYVLVDPDYLETRPRTNAGGLAQIFGEMGPAIRHLDYGGGNGVLSAELRNLGWQSLSYDPFVDLGARLAELGTFDLVTAYEVFEHVPDPRQLVATLSSLLVDDGIALFSTLLVDGNVRPGERLTWWYASPRNGHISLYSKRSLELLAGANDFTFGSFSAGLHAFWRHIPIWAAHIFPEN